MLARADPSSRSPAYDSEVMIDPALAAWESRLPETVRMRVIRALALAAGELTLIDAQPWRQTGSLHLTVQGEGAEFNYWATRVETRVVPLIQFDEGFHRDLVFDPDVQTALLDAARAWFGSGELDLPLLLRPSYLAARGSD